MIVRNVYTLSICFNADTDSSKKLIAALQKRLHVHYHAQVALLTIMHENVDIPQTQIQQNKILLSQQSLGTYQAVLQYEAALAMHTLYKPA